MRHFGIPIVIACVVCLLSSLMGCRKHAPHLISDSTWYVITEGQGVDSVARIGGDIDEVIERWAKPDRVASDEVSLFFSDKLYSYNKRGIELFCSWGGEIEQISLYCNTGDTSTFHQTGLVWINPSSVYGTFRGKTSKGLILHSRLKADEVYAVYGKPVVHVRWGTKDLDSLTIAGQPYILDMESAGSTINYPDLGICFTSFADLVESVVISDKRLLTRQ